MTDKEIGRHAYMISCLISAYCKEHEVEHGADIAVIMAGVTGYILGRSLLDREALVRNWKPLAQHILDEAMRSMDRAKPN